MPDYGRDLQFGIFVIPEAASLDQALAVTETADHMDLDLIGVQDHPYQRRFLDAFTLMTFLASRTTRVSFFPDVVCLPLRPPAVLAKMAASLDIVSGGRFELGLGAGAFWDAIEGYGGPRRTPGQALAALAEAIEVIRLLWSGDRSLHFDGEHYQLKGVHSGPVPAHPVGIWLGVGGPRSLDLLGRSADGWVPSLPSTSVESLAAKNEIIDAAAVEAGRNPSDIRRIANVNGLITDGSSEGYLRGPSQQWTEDLTNLAVVHGFDSFVFWPQENPLDQARRFADVAGAVRSAVADARQ